MTTMETERARAIETIFKALSDPECRAYIITELRKLGENDLADQIEELARFD